MRVVVIAPMGADRLARLAAVDPRLEIVHAWDQFAPELVADWPPHTVEWYLPKRFATAADSAAAKAERDALLAEADVVVISFPFPTHITQRAKRLRFVHQMPAGISNLRRSDLWHAAVPVTSGRGAGNTLQIAEWAIAAMFALSKNLPLATRQAITGHLDRSKFRGRQIQGKTLGVLGVGGIGSEVARLGNAVGMRVIGTRHSANPVPGVTLVSFEQLLHEADVLVACSQLTDDTFHLLGDHAFALLKPGAFVINIARGELIDETALLRALRSGSVGGFAADVYEGEFEHQPPPELLALPNVLLAPHVSGQTETPSSGAEDILRENLRRCLAGEPLLNQVDWQRGY